jgi:CRP-like cAMP-binding protein
MAQSLCEEMTIEKNEVLKMSEGIYIIISGKLGVYHSENGKNVLFNTLNPSEAFGYASLFSSDSEDAYTQIKAGKSRARMLFMNSESVEKLVLAEPRIALCIIKELTGKIRFLNKKLDSFVTSDLKHRLMKYITSLSYNDEGRARIPVSMSALAGRLGVGRASLYRLMSELTREGVIERQGNEIILKKTAE